ncbi:hypothetical protein GIB67_011879 [Kingdonia uniflora]|uniref:Glycosyl hydrolase family 32 N-terminal domain-containing protein n=1 Tax=Kingdonia uniflora TaxID=39325 RepID=A0A7J7KVR3_9MAGN|nr:hypothetical protein GIB67_011879 [Kingdonia uniflora]
MTPNVKYKLNGVFNLLMCYGVGVEASHQIYRNLESMSTPTQKQPYRTSYHFQPPKNWIIPFDENGYWSSFSTILPGNKPLIMYTDTDLQNFHVHNIALPKNLSDPFLREWIKPPQNLLMVPTEMNRINANSFRDPTIASQGPDGRWRSIIRNKECPDFFPVSTITKLGLDTFVISPSVKHVLKVSLHDTKRDGQQFGAGYDYGKSYASKTFFDSDKNWRILWGWINESFTATLDRKKVWSGVQAIPREIWLDKSRRQLVQWPIAKIKKLRVKGVHLPSTKLKGGSVVKNFGVTASQADVEVTFDLPKLDKAEIFDPSCCFVGKKKAQREEV